MYTSTFSIPTLLVALSLLNPIEVLAYPADVVSDLAPLPSGNALTNPSEIGSPKGPLCQAEVGQSHEFQARDILYIKDSFGISPIHDSTGREISGRMNSNDEVGTGSENSIFLTSELPLGFMMWRREDNNLEFRYGDKAWSTDDVWSDTSKDEYAVSTGGWTDGENQITDGIGNRSFRIQFRCLD